MTVNNRTTSAWWLESCTRSYIDGINVFAEDKMNIGDETTDTNKLKKEKQFFLTFFLPRPSSNFSLRLSCFQMLKQCMLQNTLKISVPWNCSYFWGTAERTLWLASQQSGVDLISLSLYLQKWTQKAKAGEHTVRAEWWRKGKEKTAEQMEPHHNTGANQDWPSVRRGTIKT